MEDMIKELQDRMERLENSNAEYRQRYGTGTRPAWVSEEIGINMMYIDIAKKQIAELKGETE